MLWGKAGERLVEQPCTPLFLFDAENPEIVCVYLKTSSPLKNEKSPAQFLARRLRFPKSGIRELLSGKAGLLRRRGFGDLKNPAHRNLPGSSARRRYDKWVVVPTTLFFMAALLQLLGHSSGDSSLDGFAFSVVRRFTANAKVLPAQSKRSISPAGKDATYVSTPVRLPPWLAL